MNTDGIFSKIIQQQGASYLTLFCQKLVKEHNGASLVAQWLGVCLPMQGTRVRALVREDPTCRGATGPANHNCWACRSGACAPQQERPWRWEARAQRWRVAPARHNQRKPSHRNEDPTQPKIYKLINLYKKKKEHNALESGLATWVTSLNMAAPSQPEFPFVINHENS